MAGFGTPDVSVMVNFYQHDYKILGMSSASGLELRGCAEGLSSMRFLDSLSISSAHLQDQDQLRCLTHPICALSPSTPPPSPRSLVHNTVGYICDDRSDVPHPSFEDLEDVVVTPLPNSSYPTQEDQGHEQQSKGEQEEQMFVIVVPHIWTAVHASGPPAWGNFNSAKV